MLITITFSKKEKKYARMNVKILRISYSDYHGISGYFSPK